MCRMNSNYFGDPLTFHHTNFFFFFSSKHLGSCGSGGRVGRPLNRSQAPTPRQYVVGQDTKCQLLLTDGQETCVAALLLSVCECV